MSEWFVLAFLALNTVGALVYSVVCWLRHPERRALTALRGAFLTLCPFVSALFFLLGEAARRLLFRTPSAMPIAAFDKRAGGGIVIPDMRAELDVIPLEEALIVSDKRDMRRLLLNVLKNGADGATGALSLALASEDSEAAHYSASAVADLISGFQQKTAALQETVDAHPDDESAYVALIEYLLLFLKNGILSDRELLTYANRVAELLDALLRISPLSALPQYFSQLVALYISVPDLPLARKWAERMRDICPDTLECYEATLHMTYAAGDGAGFAACLAALKRSSVPINKEVLDLIRAFS